MKKYFLHNGTEQQGPFDLDELKARIINKDTPIWYDGLPDWTTAEKIDELKDILRTSTPPPFSTKQSAPPPNNKPKTQQQSLASRGKKENEVSLWRVVQIIAGLFLGGLLIMFLVGKFNESSIGSGESYEQKVMTVEEIERATPTDFLSASGTYKETFWGDKFKVNCVITNKATVATYKDAVIRIIYYSKTKTELGSKDYTIYEIFPPSSTKTVELKIENYKDVNSLGWDVISAISN